MTPNSYEHLVLKIDNLESHIRNLIFPLQEIRELNKILSKPLQVKADEAEILLQNVIRRIEDFFKRLQNVEKAFSEVDKIQDYLHKLIEYTRNLSKIADEMAKEGYKHTLELHVKDGTKEPVVTKVPLSKTKTSRKR